MIASFAVVILLFAAGWVWVAVSERPETQYPAQYQKAVAEAEQIVPRQVAQDLVRFRADEPVAVDSWISEQDLARFREASGNWLAHAPHEIWVTVEPGLQKFCTAYFAAHGRNLDRLTLRLEQRLGLPPDGVKREFLEIRLERPTPDVIFRPCIDPATDRADCLDHPGAEPVDLQHRKWLHKQFADSYESSPQNAFPWTGLGYTFDWAPGAQPGEFERFGESEFVIRQGAPIRILRAVDTAAYCSST
jgi:hypothetical protein